MNQSPDKIAQAREDLWARSLTNPANQPVPPTASQSQVQISQAPSFGKIKAPDAVRFSAAGFERVSKTNLSRAHKTRAVIVAQVLLQVDLVAGESAYVHDCVSHLFATRDPDDTQFFPRDHPRQGEARYHWLKQGHGIELGYIKDADAATCCKPDPNNPCRPPNDVEFQLGVQRCLEIQQAMNRF